MFGNRSLSLLLTSLKGSLRAKWGFFLMWRVITFALVFLGFLALAFTGELHPAVIVLFTFFWGCGFFISRPPWWWRGWMSGLLIWGALLLIGVIALQAKFTSVLYLLLFLSLYKCYTLHDATDHMHALVIAFFMFLACSLITTSISYLFFMLLFVILMMLDLICLTIAREGNRSLAGRFTPEEAASRAPMGAGRTIFSRLMLSSLLTGLVVLVMTFLIFLILPHYSANRILSPIGKQVVHRKPPVSGFNDELTLDAIDHMELDDTQVMTVAVSWADKARRPLPAGLRLRGLALDDYDEKKWGRSPVSQEKDSHAWDTVNLPPTTSYHGPVLNQRINQNIYLTQRLFGVANPFRYQMDEHPRMGRPRKAMKLLSAGPMMYWFRVRLDWRTQSLQVLLPVVEWNSDRIIRLTYKVYSNWTQEATPLLRILMRREIVGNGRSGGPGGSEASAPADPLLPTAGQEDEGRVQQYDPALRLSEGDRAINTALPPTRLTRRLKAISQEVARAKDVPGKIVQLMGWFFSDFEYSLKPETPEGMHPVEAFLTKTHKGHCEYFASSLVLLLRAQGIPARIATGFYTTEWSPEAQVYTVRQSDAHAWAEVWLDGYGWLTLDPTPPDWRGRAARAAEVPSLLDRLDDKMRSFWQHYVLDYSDMQQDRLVSGLSLSRMVWKMMQFTSSIPERIGRLKPAGFTHELRIGWKISNILSVMLILLAAGLMVLATILLFLRRRGRGGDPRSPIFFMNELIERLEAVGWSRAESQTPAELVAHVERETQGRWQLLWIVELYHRCRFAQESPTAAEAVRVSEALRRIR